MRLWKTIRKSFFTTIALGSVGTVIVSCGKHTSPNSNTFEKFAKDANNEKAYNVVKNADPAAVGWAILPEKSFTKSNFLKFNNYVTMDITSNIQNKKAIFTAKYKKDKPYVVTDWSCTTQPGAIYSFDQFVKDAEKETAYNIVKNADPEAKGWSGLPETDFSKSSQHQSNNSVIVTINSKSLFQLAIFSAIYTENKKYNITDWKCTTMPIDNKNFQDFENSAEKETPAAIVKNANPPANSWKSFKDTDFGIYSKPIVYGTAITTIINSKSTGEIATFSATYTGQKYVVNVWKCIVQPKKNPEFRKFKDAAELDTARGIVKYANPGANGWRNVQDVDLTKSSPQETYNSIIYNITNADTKTTAVFSATFKGVAYKEADVWACIVQPTNSFDFNSFKTRAEAENINNIFKFANPTAVGWTSISQNDLVKTSTKETTNSVVETITSSKYHNFAIFTAIYQTNKQYIVESWTCTTQPVFSNTFAIYSKAAQAESAINIVNNSNPPPNNWTGLTKDDLTKVDSKVYNNIIAINIKNKKSEAIAVFAATYTNGATYKVSDWVCQTQPTNNFDFNTFKSTAEKETAKNIVINANPSAHGWDVNSSQLGYAITGSWVETTNTVSIKIERFITSDLAETGTFTATYKPGVPYQLNEWSCSVQPATASRNSFMKAAKAESVANILKYSDPHASAWDGLPAGDVYKLFYWVINNGNTFRFCLRSKMQNTWAYFEANYSDNKSYDAKSDWKCTILPN